MYAINLNFKLKQHITSNCQSFSSKRNKTTIHWIDGKSISKYLNQHHNVHENNDLKNYRIHAKRRFFIVKITEWSASYLSHVQG